MPFDTLDPRIISPALRTFALLVSHAAEERARRIAVDEIDPLPAEIGERPPIIAGICRHVGKIEALSLDGVCAPSLAAGFLKPLFKMGDDVEMLLHAEGEAAGEAERADGNGPFS